MTYTRAEDLLRCQAKYLALREAAVDLLGVIHGGLLTPATEDPAVLAFLTEMADRLAMAAAPDTQHPIYLHTYQD